MSPGNRWLCWTQLPLLLVLLTVASGRGQPAPQPDPSPLAPVDLKRPIFDTRTPVYDTAHAEEKSAATVVAEVDGRAVTLGDVSDAVKELPPSVSSLPFTALYPSVLARLVRQQALVIKAQQQGLDDDPAIRRKVKAATDQVIANALLQKELAGLVSENALLDRYNQTIAGKPGPAEVHVRVIMVPTEEAASALIGELRSGGDFATLAKRSSKDVTAADGGDLGYLQLDGLSPEIGAVAFALQPGQFSPYPVRSSGNWFIVKVEDRRLAPTPAFSEVRDRLQQAMMREGVDNVVTRTLAGLTVREYSIEGKEAPEPNTNN